MLTLILGGARSGKSKMAQRLAEHARRVTYIATAAANPDHDPEMVSRIQRHRADRPQDWQTIEEPLALGTAVEQAVGESDLVLVDCLTIWLSNLFWEHRGAEPSEVEAAARAGVRQIARAARDSQVILVSNELGGGTVPEHPLARTFRDAQGHLNQWAAEAADQVILTVAGLPLYLKTVAPQEVVR